MSSWPAFSHNKKKETGVIFPIMTINFKYLYKYILIGVRLSEKRALGRTRHYSSSITVGSVYMKTVLSVLFRN